MSKQQSPLKLYLLDINSQNKAILEFFVAGAGREFYTLVNNIDQAEIFITDFDFPDAQKNWQELNLQSTKPSLILAMRDPEMPDAEWLSKPMTSDALIDAAKKYMPAVLEYRQSSQEASSSKAQDVSSSRARPLSHERIGSRVLSTSLGAFAATRASAKSTPEAISVQGKPLINVDNGGAITLERPSAKADSLTEALEETKDVVNTELADAISEEESVSEDVSSADQFMDVPAISESSVDAGSGVVDGGAASADAEEILTEEEILDEQRQNSPIFVRDKLAPEQARLRWQELCGTHPDYTPAELRDIRNTGYNCESHLQGSFIAALRLSKQTHNVVQVKYEPYVFFVIDEEGLIVSPLDPKSTEFTELCSHAVRPGQINLHILDTQHSKELQDSVKEESESAYELESFIWSTCLVSSQGRLPTYFECDKQYLLKHWPNFTRMENFPFAMKIAALWHHEPSKLYEVAEKLEIPQRYIIAFYNAAMGLSLFESDPDKVQSKLIEPPKKKRSGIIARLFSRLAGGMSNA